MCRGKPGLASSIIHYSTCEASVMRLTTGGVSFVPWQKSIGPTLILRKICLSHTLQLTFAQTLELDTVMPQP